MLRGQIDISARVIWMFEKLGWARDVKWPDPVRLAAKRSPSRQPATGLSGTTRAPWTMTGSPPRPRVRMTGAQRRQQLLDIGRELFGQKGYEATSIEEIAARADVSKPVVYEHFGGKEGLYAVVVDREMQLLLDRFTSALSRARASPASCSSGRRWCCWSTSRTTPTASGCSPATPRSPAASARSRR